MNGRLTLRWWLSRGASRSRDYARFIKFSRNPSRVMPVNASLSLPQVKSVMICEPVLKELQVGAVLGSCLQDRT